MKSQIDTAFKVSTLTAALMVVYGVPAFAQSDDVAERIRPESSVSAGVGYQSRDRAQLGVFDGRQEDGGKILLDADINKRDDATGIWNQLKITNFGLDSRELDLRHSRQGDYGVAFEYSRIPRETQFTVNTGLRGIGSETQGVTVITPGAGSNVQLGTHRDRYTLGFNKIFGGSLELTVKYRQEEKKGLRNFSSYSGAQAIFLVEPIDSSTRQIDAALNYVGKDLQLQGGYYGSWYDNANRLLTVTTAIPSTVYVSLPPDNKADQFFVNGAYAFSPTTKATMRLAHTTATQDDQGLLSALPPAQVWAGYGGVKAKVVTREAQFGISGRPMKDLSLLANVQYHDRADKTPHVPYNNLATPDETTPQSFKKLNAKMEASYRVQQGFSVKGGVYWDVRERSIPFSEFNNAPAAPTVAVNWTVPTVATNEREVPYRAKTEELTFKAQATKNISDVLNGSLALAHSERDGSNFYWADQMNLVNPLHMADRDRNKVGLKLDWSPSQAVSIQAQFDQAKDDYGRNGLNADKTAATGGTTYTLGGTGIKDGSANLFSLDASFLVSDKWRLEAWYSRDETKATQFAYQANFGRNLLRKIDLADTGDSLGIGIKGSATEKLTLGADLQWNKSVGKYQQSNSNNQANIVEDLPNITNKTTRLALNGVYQLDKKSSVRVDLIHDRWDTNDWSWMMWNNAQTTLVPMAYATDGTSASASSKQSASFVAVRYKYDF